VIVKIKRARRRTKRIVDRAGSIVAVAPNSDYENKLKDFGSPAQGDTYTRKIVFGGLKDGPPPQRTPSSSSIEEATGKYEEVEHANYEKWFEDCSKVKKNLESMQIDQDDRSEQKMARNDEKIIQI
jgi:hypothetical protein